MQGPNRPGAQASYLDGRCTPPTESNSYAILIDVSLENLFRVHVGFSGGSKTWQSQTFVILKKCDFIHVENIKCTFVVQRLLLVN